MTSKLQSLLKMQPSELQSFLNKLETEERLQLIEALETLRLAKARESLKTFAQTVEVPGTPPPTWVPDDPHLDIRPKLKLAPHHELIVDTIQKLADGKSEAKGVMVFMPPGSAKPVWEESDVLMGDGEVRKLKDIAVGDYVIGKSGKPRKVLEIHIQGKLDCLRVETAQGRELIAEASHPVLTVQGWKNVGRLEENDVLAIILPNKHDELFYPDEVIDVQPIGKKKCRCLTVEDDHSFVANDIVVHNSTYCSVIAPAWLAGRRPNYNVIAASYGDKLAVRFGRRVREIIKQPIYEKIMGTRIKEGVQSASEWGLECDSDYLAVGMGAAVTGFRADLLIIDDPVKNREEADSETIQEKTWDAYRDDLRTRLKPGGVTFIIQTRWHEADLSGKLLGDRWEGQSGLWEGTDKNTWEIINLPLYAEHPDDPLGRKEGELLWSDYFRDDQYAGIKANADAGDPGSIRTWTSLYQQRPSPLEGTILKKSWWRKWEEYKLDAKGNQILDKNHLPIPEAPVCEYVFASYDTAFSEDEYESNSYSAGTFWGIFETSHSNRFSVESSAYHAILLGAWRAHVDFRDLVDTVHDHYKQFLKPYGNQCKILVEKRASGTSLIQELKRARLPVKAIELEGPPGSRGKVPRAMQASYMLADGVIWYLPTAANVEAIKECSAFPNSTHTDFVDSICHAINWLRKYKRLDMPWDTLSPQEQQDWEYEQYRQSRIKRNLYGSSATRRRPSSESPRLYGR